MAFESKTLQCSLLTAHTGRGIEGCLICDPRTWPVKTVTVEPAEQWRERRPASEEREPAADTQPG